jgi:hypothetical protein
MNAENLFITASRKSYRFTSRRGPLTVEQLWQLPLTGKEGFDLNNVAKTAKAELGELTSDEDDFVGLKQAVSGAQDATNKLEIVKFVIGEKKAEAKAAAEASEKGARRKLLLDILERKETSALESMSVEEVRKQLESL